MTAHAQVMASQGGTFFFDRDADFVAGVTSAIRTEFLFGDLADGASGSIQASEQVYRDLVRGAPPPCLLALDCQVHMCTRPPSEAAPATRAVRAAACATIDTERPRRVQRSGVYFARSRTAPSASPLAATS